MADADSSSRFPRVGRWVLFIAAGLLVLVLLAAALLPWLYPPERLEAFVVPRMEEAIGREVEIETIRMRVIPYPAVRVSNFRVANAEGFGPEPAVEGEALNVDVALWPLFTGTIHPTSVEFVEPVLRYQVAENGDTNVDDLFAEEDTAGTEEAPLEIGVDELRASGARVVYDDREAGQSMFFTFGTRLSVTPDPDQGAVESEGTVDVDSIQVVQAETPSDTLALQDAWISYDLRMTQAEGRLELRQLSVETPPLAMSVTGTVTDLDSSPTADLQFETDESNLSALAAVMPGTTMEDIDPRGTLRLEGKVQGPLSDTTDGSALTMKGEGALTDFGMDYQGITMLEGVEADLLLSQDSLAVQSIEGQLLDNPLTGRLAVRDLTGEPTFGGHLNGTADLDQLPSLPQDGSDEALDVGGTVAFDVRFQGPVSAPSDVRLEGPIRLSDVRYGTPSLRAPLQIPEATVELTGTGVSTDRLPMQSGDTQMVLGFNVQDLFPLSKGLAETNPAANVSFSLTSDRMDLVQLFPEDTEVTYSQLMSAHLASTTVEGQSPEEVAEERYGGTELPQLSADGRVEIATLLNPPQRFDDVTFDVQLRDRRLELQNLTAQAYEGQIAGQVVMDQSQATESASLLNGAEGSVLMASATPAVAPQVDTSTPPTTLAYDLQVQNAEANAFLQDWTQLGSAITGTLNFSVSGRSPLTDGLLPVTDALQADGRSVVADGGFDETFGLPQAVIQRLGITPPSLRDFEQFGGPFTIENGQFVVDEWSLATNQLQTSVSGTLGLGGAVNLALQMDLPLSLVEGSNLPGMTQGEMDALFQRLGGEDRTMQLQVGLGGTVQNPEVQIDDEAVQKQFRQLAREAGRGLVQSLFDSGGGN